MISILVAGVALLFLPTILRGFALGLLVVGAVLALHVVLLAAVALAQQPQKWCYTIGTKKVCTTDAAGRVAELVRLVQAHRVHARPGAGRRKRRSPGQQK